MRSRLCKWIAVWMLLALTACSGGKEEASFSEPEQPPAASAEESVSELPGPPMVAQEPEASMPENGRPESTTIATEVPLWEGASVREFRFRDNDSLAYLQSNVDTVRLSLYDFGTDQLLAEVEVDPSARYLFKLDGDTWRVTTDAAVETYGYSNGQFTLLESTPVTAKIPPGVEVYDQAPSAITPDGKHWIYEVDNKQKVYLSDETGTGHQVLLDCNELVGYGGVWWFEFYGDYLAYYITGSPVVEGEAVGVIHIPSRRSVVVEDATSVAFLEGERAVFKRMRTETKGNSYLCDLTTMELAAVSFDGAIGANGDGSILCAPYRGNEYPKTKPATMIVWDQRFRYSSFMDLDDLGLQIPLASYDGKTALSEDGKTLVVHCLNQDGSGMVTKLVLVEYPVRPHERTELPLGKMLSELPPESYFTYNAATFPENQRRIEEWIEAFRTGQPAQLSIMREKPINEFALATLECDGSAEYTITFYDENCDTTTRRSQTVIKRATDYVFAGGLPTDSRYEDLQFLVLTHTPIEAHASDGVEYDLASSPPLGVTTPQQAIEIATQRDAQRRQYGGKDANLFGWGLYFPPDLEIDDVLPGSMVVDGAMEVLGRPCYIVGEPAYGCIGYDTYAVAADGSGLVFRISAADGHLLFADPNQEVIRAD